MKKVRILLSVAAIIFAVAGTVAGKLHSELSMTGYEYIPANPPAGAQCISFTTDCNTTDQTLCTINNHKVGISNVVSSSCGNQLKWDN